MRVTQLLYLPPVASSTAPFGVVPAFFAGLSQFFLYYYDGRSNQITRCVVDIINENERGVYRVQMFMNVKDYNRYHLCENVYYGTMTHYNTLTMLVLQNQNMEIKYLLYSRLVVYNHCVLYHTSVLQTTPFWFRCSVLLSSLRQHDSVRAFFRTAF